MPHRLLENRNYLFSVLLSATDAIVSLNSEGGTCFWSTAAHSLFG